MSENYSHICYVFPSVIALSEHISIAKKPKKKSIGPLTSDLREDTQKKSFFFSGRTPMGVGRVNPPDH